MNGMDGTTKAMLFIVVGIILAVVIVMVAVKLSFILRNVQYINGEIRRSRGREKEYWKREKVRLWLSILPFMKY